MKGSHEHEHKHDHEHTHGDEETCAQTHAQTRS